MCKAQIYLSDFEIFSKYIFPLRMRELSGSGQKVSDAVIGAVGPTYINILVPSEKAHTLESHMQD